MLVDQAAFGQRRPVYSAADRLQVHTLGYRWVVLDKGAYEEETDARRETSLVGRAPWVRRSLTNLLGAPVYEDEQTVIYAPWGDGSPCGAGSGSTDASARPG
jgi:hypothetical protein